LRLEPPAPASGDSAGIKDCPGDEVAPSLKFATATVQRTSAKAAAGATKGGQFNDEPPF
jgi:hypothetical protein